MGLPKFLLKALPEKWVYHYTLQQQKKVISSNITVEEWIAQGKPLPPPPVVKRSAMKAYAAKYKAAYFVETGTFLGDTTFEMNDHFHQLFTIELDRKLYERAVARFKPFPTVSVLQGDSGTVLKQVLRQIPREKTGLFWLDGHFSGGVTAKADLDSPIIQELDEIFRHSKDHVIFIDDARLFFSTEYDYPPFEELKRQIHRHNPNALVEIVDDVVRITPY